MNELVGFGASSVDSRHSRSEHRSVAGQPPGEVMEAVPATTSLTAALEKKHTFDCLQPTRGGLCDC
jgi:hypothetical protein